MPLQSNETVAGNMFKAIGVIATILTAIYTGMQIYDWGKGGSSISITCFTSPIYFPEELNEKCRETMFVKQLLYFEITNGGSKEVKDLNLINQFTGFYLLEREGEKNKFEKLANNKIVIDSLGPSSKTKLSIWVTNHISPYSDMPKFTHSEGVISVDYAEVVVGWGKYRILITALITVPLAAALALFIEHTIVEDLKSRRRY